MLATATVTAKKRFKIAELEKKKKGRVIMHLFPAYFLAKAEILSENNQTT